MDKVAEGFGCHGEYLEQGGEIGPAIARAYASGKVGVVHVAIDPKANSEEMPKYGRIPDLVCRRHPVRQRSRKGIRCDARILEVLHRRTVGRPGAAQCF